MATRQARIVHLAVADGRGHLMRAHLLRRLLANRGIAVDIVTTSDAGRRFLSGLGTPAAVLPGGFEVAFDGQHHMLAATTDRRLAAYIASPWRLGRDAAMLRRLARGALLVVNDSLHPAALLLAGLGARWGARVVHLHGDGLWRAAVSHFDARMPTWVSAGYRRLLAALRDSAFGCVEHSLAAADRAGVTLAPTRFRLPPLVRPPLRPRAAVRRALGLAPGERLAAIYLNPHFRDAAIAVRLEAALAAAGFRHYGVSEPWAGRPGWRASDAAFSDVVAASDVFVSGAGAAAMAQARLCAVPLLALVGDQPEQALNLATGRDAGTAFAAVSVSAGAPLGDAIATLARAPLARDDAAVRDEHADIGRLWGDAFASLAAQAERETHGHDSDDSPGSGDQQPARRRRRRHRRRADARAVARSAARADAAARVAG